MKEILDPIKNRFDNLKSSIELIAGCITTAIGILALATKLYESKYTIAIICIGLFFLVKMVSDEIIQSKKELFGIIVNKYATGKIRTAKIVRYANYLLLFFPLFLIGSTFMPVPRGCNDNISDFGLIITSFSKLEDDDDFSYKLFDLVEAELENTDTVNLLRTGQFVTTGEKNYLDSIRQTFERNCLSRGILVFGKRNTGSKLFDCKIYINGLLRFNYTRKKNVVYIQNPDLINFSIDYQAKTVGEFVMGLLYYCSGNNKLSKAKFRQSLKLNTSDDKRFKSFCHLFLGNIHFNERNYETARNEYLMGLSNDSLNAILHFNLATTYLYKTDSVSALDEYKTACKINDKMINPLRESGIKPVSKPNAFPKIEGAPQNAHRPPRKKDPQIKAEAQTVAPALSRQEPVKIAGDYSPIRKGDLAGIMNSKGDIIVQCIYDSICFYPYKGKTFFIVRKNDKYGALYQNAVSAVPIKHASALSVQRLIQQFF